MRGLWLGGCQEIINLNFKNMENTKIFLEKVKTGAFKNV